MKRLLSEKKSTENKSSKHRYVSFKRKIGNIIAVPIPKLALTPRRSSVLMLYNS